jgi:hypothetical protein
MAKVPIGDGTPRHIYRSGAASFCADDLPGGVRSVWAIGALSGMQHVASSTAQPAPRNRR